MAAIDTCTRHAPTARQDTSPPSDLQGMLAVPRRRIICRAQDLINAVLFVCEGWAASILTLPNGDRQIVSFLLPGDIVSSTLLFRDKPGLLVESITDVACRSFDRSELARRFMSDRSAFGVIAALWIEEKECGEGLVVDLGRRTAEERIARLILSLMDRLASRGMAQGQTIDFPLRQHHIADATGLTPVHVSKLLTDFRRRGLIRISDRSLEVLDDPGLRRVAGIR